MGSCLASEGVVLCSLASEGPVLYSLAVTHVPSSLLRGKHTKGMEDRKQVSSDLGLKWQQVELWEVTPTVYLQISSLSLSPTRNQDKRSPWHPLCAGCACTVGIFTAS